VAIGEGFDAVLAAARRGDRAAFELLYRDLAPLVLGYLRANGSREPEDLTAEVFVAVVRGIERFEGDESSFRSWVLTIAHRRLTDEFRRRGRRPEQPLEPGVLREQLGGADGTAESEALERLASVGVLDVLERLTPDQRAVISLRVLADLPIKEVAELLEKPVTAVKSLQHRALAALERQLALVAELTTDGTTVDASGDRIESMPRSDD
jgi:RNA polymerase sigma-70 factor (ECF subfamily)